MKSGAAFLIVLVRAYRVFISPMKTFLFGPGSGCRYVPTCSTYAIEALSGHGAVRGVSLIAGRICRCHPWGGYGHDPVPVCRKP